MAQRWLLQGACAIGALAAIIMSSSPAAAMDKGHRFLATLHGGAATEAGGGATVELRVLDDICVGGGFDLGVNLNGTYGSYNYMGPAVHGSYKIKLTDTFELRPFFGARFPIGVEATDTSKYTITENASVAFTTALRASFILDIFVIGVEADITPHVVTWQNVPTGKLEETNELLIRAALVFGVALGPDQ